MKVQVKYKENVWNGIREFVRIITFQEKYKMCKTKIKQNLYSNMVKGDVKYYEYVKRTLHLTKDELLQEVVADILKQYQIDIRGTDKKTLSKQIQDYKIELEIDLEG